METPEMINEAWLYNKIITNDLEAIRAMPAKAFHALNPNWAFEGMPLLHRAVTSGELEYVDLLLTHPSIVVNQIAQATQETALHLALSQEDIRILQALIASGANVNHRLHTTNQSPLVVAMGIALNKSRFEYFNALCLAELDLTGVESDEDGYSLIDEWVDSAFVF